MKEEYCSREFEFEMSTVKDGERAREHKMKRKL